MKDTNKKIQAMKKKVLKNSRVIVKNLSVAEIGIILHVAARLSKSKNAKSNENTSDTNSN